MQSSSTLGFQRSFDSIRHALDPLRPFRDPATVLDGLHRSPGDPDARNQILTALVEAAQSDGSGANCALTLLLLALWPGLDAIRRRSLWRRLGSADEITSDVLARTTVAVRGLNLTRVTRVAATILRNVERDMIRARQRDAARETLASDIDPDAVPTDQAGRHHSLEDSQLQADIRRLIGADAILVLRVALEGVSQAEVAVELGQTEAAARKRYQRALRRLRDAFEEKP